MSGFILFHRPLKLFELLLDKALKDFADTNDSPFCVTCAMFVNAVSLPHIENCDCDVCTRTISSDLSWSWIVLW